MRISKALDALCEHAEYFKNYSENTLDRYSSVVKNFKRSIEVNQVENISEKKVRKFFVNGRSKRDWSPETFITYQQTLTVFFRWCINQGYMENNYAEDIQTPKKEKKLPKSLNREEAEKIIEYAYNLPYGHNENYLRHRNRAIFATFIFTGLRRQELLDLGNGDVDLEHKSIFVNKGKGSKDRYVPITARLSKILKKYRKVRGQKNKTCPSFFVSCREDTGFTPSGLKRLTDRIEEESGISFSPHVLRHTFATLMLEGGTDIYSLSKMLGHEKIETTAVYLAASSKHLESEIDKHPLN
ncbi:MAG: tyrosine-type recombinase/integrase [Candidatus Magasanikbacteria bacterium]